MKTWTTETWVAGAPKYVLELLTDPEDRDERIAYRAEIASELVDQFDSHRESMTARGGN
jgi:hypothetical protein